MRRGGHPCAPGPIPVIRSGSRARVNARGRPTAPKMHIRPAHSTDASAIAALHAASWRATYRGILTDEYLDGDIVSERMAVWAQRLGSPAPNQYVMAAVSDGTLAGFACAFGGHDPRWGTLLDNLHVATAFQGRGTGLRLLAKVAARASLESPSSGLHLRVFAANTRARRFYEGLGAVDAGPDSRDSPGDAKAASHLYVWSRIGELIARCASVVRGDPG